MLTCGKLKWLNTQTCTTCFPQLSHSSQALLKLRTVMKSAVADGNSVLLLITASDRCSVVHRCATYFRTVAQFSAQRGGTALQNRAFGGGTASAKRLAQPAGTRCSTCRLSTS